MLVALLWLGVTSAFAETRSLKVHHLHTGEKAEIVFKRNGRYDQAGLKKINHILRDWRRNEPIGMDPRLLDLVWQAYRASGSRGYLKVVSGYRAPATNAMLRSRSKGVAQKSQHMVGKAMDFFLPDVPLKKLRDIGLKMQAGGVGYYPNSGSPFIHLDVGNVRHWPGISRKELAGLFPDGKTLHVPSDGKPLPGYAQALAAYNSRQASGAPAVELASLGGSQGKKRGLLATLFGGGEDEADDVADVASAAPRPRKTVKAQRTEIPMAVEQAPKLGTRPEVPDSIVAALTGGSIPLPAFAPRRTTEPAVLATIPVPENTPFGMADASTAPVEMALADPVGVAPDMVAINIPLPTKRPEYRASPIIAPGAPISPDRVGTLLALNQSDDELDRLSGQRPSAPVPAAAGRVRTSPKTGRVEHRGDQPAAPVVVPGQLQASYWPLETDRGITGAISSTDAPRLSTNFIRTAPLQAYVEGFNANRKSVDHKRFTGTAVNFLPIARFY